MSCFKGSWMSKKLLKSVRAKLRDCRFAFHCVMDALPARYQNMPSLGIIRTYQWAKAMSASPLEETKTAGWNNLQPYSRRQKGHRIKTGLHVSNLQWTSTTFFELLVSCAGKSLAKPTQDPERLVMNVLLILQICQMKLWIELPGLVLTAPGLDPLIWWASPASFARRPSVGPSWACKSQLSDSGVASLISFRGRRLRYPLQIVFIKRNGGSLEEECVLFGSDICV